MVCLCIMWDCAFVRSGCVLGVPFPFLSLVPVHVSLWFLLESFFLACSFLDCPILHLAPSSPLCAAVLTFALSQPRMKQSHSQFIHLSYTLLCYWFLLVSQLQLLSCPLSGAGSSLELCVCAEPSLTHPGGTGRSPWGAGRNHTAPCAASETDLGSDELGTRASQIFVHKTEKFI